MSAAFALQDSPPIEDIKALGVGLRNCRVAAGFSRKRLAEIAGVAPETLKNLEAGAVQPKMRTLLHLSAIPQLQFDPRAFGVAMPATGAGDALLNCWLAPGFESLEMLQAMERCLAGAGGPLDQAFMYLDHKSAACWRSISNLVDYSQAVTHSFPAEQVAAAIVGRTHPQRQTRPGVTCTGLDILALGCGDAQTETILTQHVLAQMAKLRRPERRQDLNINLYLLDISQPLLAAGHKHASSIIGNTSGLNIFAIQGDFYRLPEYTALLYSPAKAHRRRVIWMLGCTFANLLNEVMYVRDSLIGFTEGDVLLLDLSLSYGDNDEDIMRLDPRLNGTLPEGWRRCGDEFLSGPFRRYTPNFESVTLTPRIDRSCCPVPGSYAVEIVADVRTKDGAEKRFNAFRVKRHDIHKLVQVMKGLGWNPCDGWQYRPFGGSTRSMAAVYMFEKGGARQAIHG